MDVRVALLSIPLLLASPVAAAESVLTIDAGSSSVTFTLQATMHKVHGTFGVASGEIRFDPTSGEIRGRIVVDATSGDTANEKRDRKMHAKVLRSGEHPEIEFAPASFRGKIDPAGESRLVVSGTLRLLGVDHPVELPVEVTFDGAEVRARAELIVPYVEWGLENPSVFLLRVSKTVEVSIDLAGRLTPAPS